MLSYFVRYRGSSLSPEGFAAHYETNHAEILRRFPGIRSLIVHRPADWTDPFPVTRGGTFLLAQMAFESSADLDLALRSPARREARDDFRRFPPFDGEVTHEAMHGKVIF
jgi:uncharacterized protein (TIGR02118 family)